MELEECRKKRELEQAAAKLEHETLERECEIQEHERHRQYEQMKQKHEKEEREQERQERERQRQHEIELEHLHAGWYLTGGGGGHVPLIGFRRPPHWN